MSDPFDFTDEPPPPAPHAPAAPPPYLDGLNESQREAVLATDGPVLMLAGAGTGKTRALTTRLAHILLQGKAHPGEILAVTFTNKAAKEMRERVAALLGRPVEGWWVGTFHALGARILRANAERLGLRSDFTILDADDQLRLVKQLLEARGLDEKKSPARAVLNAIQRWKDRGLEPPRVTPAEDTGEADGQALSLYGEYQERLLAVNACDFGDLLLHCLTLFREAPEVLARYQKTFRYILVDEYQDTNIAQYLWLRALAGLHKNLCCVGDDDQSIYSWRGAEVGNILRFEQDYPGARVIRLERNYRSTPHILGAASGLIANNAGRLGKTLWTDLNEGEKVVVRGVWDGPEEARVVGEEVEALQAKGHRLSEMAVLVRAGFQTREFEERLITLGIPYRVVGGLRFYERQEIRDAVAYFRVVVQPDDDLAFERIVNQPKRGLGAATLQTVHKVARAGRMSLVRAVKELVGTEDLKPKPRATLSALTMDFDRWRALLDSLPHAEVAATILEESGYFAMWKADRSPDAAGRAENLKELVNALEEFPSLPAFLEHVSLVMENDEKGDGDKLSLMTLHGAKGLEFETVFLPGWEEGLFPHQKALDEGGLASLEEERRLAYVGLTRARHRAFITFAANRQVYGQWQTALPSRFIDELPPDHVVHRSDRGLYGAEKRRRPARFEFDEEPSFLAPAPASAYSTGQRVFHDKFGYGRVLFVDGNKLEIAFDKAGTKKVMDSFVTAV